ncbi:MAG: DUF4041 domain-containing protein [Bacteroidetes bacterium]|nr:DUF4041 domain-containing protein [Bacteroidota bacterium]
MAFNFILAIALILASIYCIILYTKLKQKKNDIDVLKQELDNTNTSIEKNSIIHNSAIKELNEINDTSLMNLTNAKQRINQLELTYASLIAIDQEIIKREININELKEIFLKLNEKYQTSLQINRSLEIENELYIETLDISSYGLYKPLYSFDFPEQYLVELEGIYTKQKVMIKNRTAAVCHTEWSLGGSKTEGRKMTEQELKLMLLAFNGESDSIIARVKWNNVGKSREKILKTFQDINKLGSVSSSEITHEYLNLKFEELTLVYEYEVKKHEQKEEQRLIREQMREEEKVQKESERVQIEAEEEAKLYNKVLEKARIELGLATKDDAHILEEKIKVLEEKLKAAIEKKERAISLAQTTKVGNIYVISNIGSFGDNVYKIGMTRRFDPMERVKELSDAALPFQFDVHAIIFSENAPQFERDLHKKFTEKRINLVNNRKEFFRISLDEIETFVLEETKAEIQFTKIAEAREYRQSLTIKDKIIQTTEVQVQKGKFPSSLVD